MSDIIQIKSDIVFAISHIVFAAPNTPFRQPRKDKQKAPLLCRRSALRNIIVNVSPTNYLSRVQMLTRFQSGSLNILPTP